MNEVTSTPENEAASDVTQGEVQQQVTEAESQPELPHDLSMDSLSPDALAEMFGIDEVSQQAQMEANALHPENVVRTEDEEQTEESTDEETESEESAVTEDDDAAEDEETSPEKIVYDIKQLADEGIVLSMKVGGEYKEFDMDAIQKYAGQSEVAEQKSRLANEDRKNADIALSDLTREREAMRIESQVRAADGQLGSLAAEIQNLDAQINQTQDRYERQELRDVRNEKFQQYSTMYAGAQQLVEQGKQQHLAAQRQKMEQMGGNAAKFLSDAEYRNEVKETLAARGMNPNALEAVANDADLLNMAITLHEQANAIKPKSRKKQPLSKTLKNTATKENKPAPQQSKLQDRLSQGDLTMAELSENRGLLG